MSITCVKRVMLGKLAVYKKLLHTLVGGQGAESFQLPKTETEYFIFYLFFLFLSVLFQLLVKAFPNSLIAFKKKKFKFFFFFRFLFFFVNDNALKKKKKKSPLDTAGTTQSSFFFFFFFFFAEAKMPGRNHMLVQFFYLSLSAGILSEKTGSL